MKRRLNMAAGLIHRPRLVLMDEPTVGVDPQSRNHIFEMIEKLRAEGMSHHLHHALHGRSRAPVRPHRHRRSWPDHRARHQCTSWCRDAFGSRSQVLARFAGADDRVAAWVAGRGGRTVNGSAEFTIEHPAEIATLLEASSNAGFELVDVSLRKPNLESVFLHLTGRELRD